VAARLGNTALAELYFRQAAEIDLANNNAASGIHAAALGGLWQAAVLGFAGLRFSGKRSEHRANLPEGSEHDPEDANTVHALGERKTRLFLQALKKGIDPVAGAEALLKKRRQAGIRTAVGSSSKKEARAAILEFVRRNASDLIALAWRGSLEPERAQTIRRVIRDASCPVIVFRARA
jgi:nucleotide-binding universal stress UspA family protein